LPAAVISGVVLVAFVLLAARVHREPAWFVPVVAVLAIPVVRLWTSGGGTIPPNEWVALAFVVGVVTWWRRVRPRQQVPVAAHPARSRSPIRTVGGG